MKFAAFLILLFCSEVNALNLKELISRSRQMIGDSPYYQSQARITDARIKDYLNEAQSYACAQFLLVDRTTVTLQSNVTEYFMPDTFLDFKRVQFKTAIIPQVSLAGLDGEGRAWGLTAGTPNSYYVRVASRVVIGFVPPPGGSGTGIAVIDFYANAAPMVNLGDNPFNGNPRFTVLHEFLPKYVAYRFFVSVGNQAALQIYANETASDIKRMREIGESMINYRPGLSAYEKYR